MELVGQVQGWTKGSLHEAAVREARRFFGPNAEVEVEISYVTVLHYDGGGYEADFSAKEVGKK